MEAQTSLKPMGRHEKPIDWEKVNKMLEAGSDGVEVAAEFRIYPDTLYRQVQAKFGVTFTAYAASIDSVGKARLRRVQYEKAIGENKKGDTTLLLHLGRTRLKQVDAQPEKNDIPPADVNLNFADAFIKAEGEKMALASKVEELEKKLEELMNKQVYIPSYSTQPFIQPPYIVTCSNDAVSCANINETMNSIGSDGNPQPEANSVLQ